MTIELTKKLVLVADQPTDVSGRIYPYNELLNICEVNKDKELLGTFIGICNDSNFDLSKVALKCKNLRMEGKALVTDFSILDTPYGLHLQKMLPDHQMCLTPRGTGKCDDGNHIHDYVLQGIDVKMC